MLIYNFISIQEYLLKARFVFLLFVIWEAFPLEKKSIPKKQLLTRKLMLIVKYQPGKWLITKDQNGEKHTVSSARQYR